jgi:membrane associated rhomboid family serine protease
MGIYDRDYYRQQRPAFSLPTPRTVVGALILVNVAIYLVDALLGPGTQPAIGRLGALLSAHVGSLVHPLYDWLPDSGYLAGWFQFLSYGFAHSLDPQHVIFNMLGLWFLGREIESVYGPKEFLRLYLAMIVFGGVVWALIGRFSGEVASSNVAGASGAVAGIVVLYALHFPRRMLLMFFVLPIPAWLAGVLLVGMDLYGAIVRPEGSHIAYTVHLAGAAFAFVYCQQRWNLGRLLTRWPRFGHWRPRLRLHTPDDEQEPDRRQEQLSREVDRILEKISREGEASLTRKERRILETASRKYQKRRQDANDRVR